VQLLKSKHSVSFRELKDCASISNGLLWSHIRALESDGLIQIRKELNGRHVKTTYVITEKGNSTFEQFRENMIKILN
jgi:DNA-binding PadR family transcriptional regulator